jgi:hypothetical protein
MSDIEELAMVMPVTENQKGPKPTAVVADS